MSISNLEAEVQDAESKIAAIETSLKNASPHVTNKGASASLSLAYQNALLLNNDLVAAYKNAQGLDVDPAPPTPTPPASTPGILGNWKPTFDSNWGSSLDTSVWTINNGWTKNGVIVDSKNLSFVGSIAALQLANANSGIEMITQKQLFNVGDYIEFYLNPQTNANWNAGWTCAVNWPTGGEYDVYEQGSFNLHWANPEKSGSGKQWPALDNKFHKYGLLRGQTTLQQYYDSEPYGSPIVRNDTGDPHSILITQGLVPGATGIYGPSGALLVGYVKTWSPS